MHGGTCWESQHSEGRRPKDHDEFNTRLQYRLKLCLKKKCFLNQKSFLRGWAESAVAFFICILFKQYLQTISSNSLNTGPEYLDSASMYRLLWLFIQHNPSTPPAPNNPLLLEAKVKSQN